MTAIPGSPEFLLIEEFEVTGRIVFSDSHAYLEFTFKAEYAYDYGMPDWLTHLDQTFSWLRAERLFLGRHKFLHFRVWYRDALASNVREVLLDSRSLSRPYLERAAVESMVEGHLRGKQNCTTRSISCLRSN